MLAFEDKNHEKNSAKYHTGKPCTKQGCTSPAGTWWSPTLCFEHNVARLNRITSNLEDAVKAAELRALIDKETETLRHWAYESARTIKAMVLAAGGTITIKNSDKDRKTSGEATDYGKDTTTFRIYP